MKKASYLPLLALAISLTSEVARADLITFENEAIGHKGEVYTVGQVTFKDTLILPGDAGLYVLDYSSQGRDNVLAVNNDVDGSGLRMDFLQPITSLSLMFGNDEPAFTEVGDLAWLDVFLGGTLVGHTTVVLNRNDLIDQSIGMTVLGGFDSAYFVHTDSVGTPLPERPYHHGGMEVVDNIEFTVAVPVPEPASFLLVGIGLGALGLVAWRRRK